MENYGSETNFDCFPYKTSFKVALPALYPPWKFQWYSCGFESMRNVCLPIQNKKQKKQRVMKAIHYSF